MDDLRKMSANKLEEVLSKKEEEIEGKKEAKET